MMVKSGTELASSSLNVWRKRFDQRLSVVRDLPWRNTRDPWAVLVAEIMLQQTQVSRVLVVWPRFLELFPDSGQCARAGQAAVVRAWAGMGYHRRAVGLYKAAVMITETFSGNIPDNEADLRSLPGVGLYTARAVLAFAFDHDVGVVDTNVARVLSRAVGGKSMTRSEMQRVADALVSANNGWAHNQAMLDFGAMVCKAKPRCSECTIRKQCSWAKADFTIPDPAKKTAGTTRPQQQFVGSDRQVRGQLLALARENTGSLKNIAKLYEPFGRDRVEGLIHDLVTDGLVDVSKSGISLR